MINKRANLTSRQMIEQTSQQVDAELSQAGRESYTKHTVLSNVSERCSGRLRCHAGFFGVTELPVHVWRRGWCLKTRKWPGLWCARLWKRRAWERERERERGGGGMEGGRERERHCWVKAGPPPPWFEFLVIFDFLHHGIEEVERYLLWKFYKKIRKKSWSNVPPKLLTCIGFLYKVVHKIIRLRKFNRSREIEFNFLTAWTMSMKFGTLV